jgi:molybdopterin converting factor small subunit
MSVKLNIDSQFFGRDKDTARDVRIDVNGRTVGECLGKYFATRPQLTRDFFDKSGQLEKTTYLYVNKTPVFAGHLEREVKDGDELMFLYAPQWRC